MISAKRDTNKKEAEVPGEGYHRKVPPPGLSTELCLRKQKELFQNFREEQKGLIIGCVKRPIFDSN